MESSTSQVDKFRRAELFYRRPRAEPKPSKKRNSKKTAENVKQDMTFDEFLATLTDTHSILDTTSLNKDENNTSMATFIGHINKHDIFGMGEDNKEQDTLDMFQVTSHPGLLLIPKALSMQMQLQWAKRAVEEFPMSNYSNLTNLGSQPEDLWTLCDDDSFTPFKKLRWVNLGYSYDWTNRKYRLSTEDRQGRSGLPLDIASTLGNIAVSSQSCPSFRGDTAIVNYYYLDSTMGPHVDDAELDLSRPVISLSLGASAIFLIGGAVKDSMEPTAIALHSGDLIVMGRDSRRCFHAVPRIFITPSETLTEMEKILQSTIYPGDSSNAMKLLKFLEQTRININVRQIFPEEEAAKQKIL